VIGGVGDDVEECGWSVERGREEVYCVFSHTVKNDKDLKT
jgi:hypothetical protein